MDHTLHNAFDKPAIDVPKVGPLDVDRLETSFRNRTATVGVIGLGYVGLPLARAMAEKGFMTLGFDIDHTKIARLNAGGSYIRHVSGESIARLRDLQQFAATDDFSRIPELDAIVLCVPTPLDRRRDPDLGFIVRTAESVASYLRRGQLVVLEFDHVSGHHP